MTSAHSDDDQMEDGDEGASGDIIARAKGMDWLDLFTDETRR